MPTEVLGVSSFWGNPPSTDYHPSSMLGNQSCFSVGECPNEQAWVSDATAYPNPGTKLIVTGDAGNDLVVWAEPLLYCDLLLAEAPQGALFDGVPRLDGLGRREGPARARTQIIPLVGGERLLQLNFVYHEHNLILG